MKKLSILASVAVLMSLSVPAFSAEKKHETVVAQLPVCTGANSVFDVLGDKCHLVKGSNIYGDIASLSGLSDLGSLSSGGVGGTMGGL